jgi:hypothetical protein
MESAGLMDLTTLPFVWAQAPAQPAAGPNSMALLALRRWFAGLTLSSPQDAPDFHPQLAFLAGLGLLLALVICFHGPVLLLKQLFDLPGHVRIVQKAARRVWLASRMVTVMIGFTVLAWTAGQALIFLRQDTNRLDLALLTKLRGLSELALEQGSLAAVTPLRDVAALGDNMILLLIAAIMVFRASLDIPGWGIPADRDGHIPGFRPRTGWSTPIWCSAMLYVLYRAVSWGAGTGDLPVGGCLVAEAFFVPVFMIISDGFLLAWLLAELRNAGFDNAGEDRLDIRHAIALMPAAAVACAFALPSRYIATFVWLCVGYLPTWASSSSLGNYVRWQLGWGLTDLQAGGLLFIGLAGAVAWSRGTVKGSLAGYGRMLAAEGGHLVAVLAMAGVASAILVAAVYAVVLLLPAQAWVLPAADSYAHYATLPVGLWTLAALIELAERSLPSASLRRAVGQPSTAQSLAEVGASELQARLVQSSDL